MKTDKIQRKSVRAKRTVYSASLPVTRMASGEVGVVKRFDNDGDIVVTFPELGDEFDELIFWRSESSKFDSQAADSVL